MNDYMDDINAPIKTLEEQLAEEEHEELTLEEAFGAENLVIHDPKRKCERTDYIRGTLFAVTGAFAGSLIWLFLDAVGLDILAMLCPLLVTAGAFSGFMYITRDVHFQKAYRRLICMIIIILFILLMTRAAFCSDLADLAISFCNRTETDLKTATGYDNVSFETCFLHTHRIADRIDALPAYYWEHCRAFMLSLGESIAVSLICRKNNLLTDFTKE